MPKYNKTQGNANSVCKFWGVPYLADHEKLLML